MLVERIKNFLPMVRPVLIFLFSMPDVFLVVKLLFFSSIVVGEYEESVDTGEITVFLGFCCDGRVFPFCLFGVIGNLFDEREGTKWEDFDILLSMKWIKFLRLMLTFAIRMPAALHQPTGKISLDV